MRLKTRSWSNHMVIQFYHKRQTHCKKDARIMKFPVCVNDIITWDFKQNIKIHADKLSLVQPLNCQSLSHYIERRTKIPRDDNRL